MTDEPASHNASKAARARFGTGTILTVVAALLPPLAVFAPLGLAPLLTAVALGVIATERQGLLTALGGLKPLGMILGTLSLWASLSCVWSILPEHSFLEGLRFFAISASGIVAIAAAGALAPHERAATGGALVFGVVLAILLLLFERWSGARITHWALGLPPTVPVPLTRYDRGTTTLCLALWPAASAVAMRRGPAWGFLLIVAAAVTAFLMLSATAALATLVAIAAFALAWAAPRAVAVALMASTVLVAVALPLATPSYDEVVAIRQEATWLKFSGIHRLLIWRFTADRIAERPLLGWGMDASRELPGGHAKFTELLPQAALSPDWEALPLHPHNAALQWEVELGAPGTVLALAAVLWALWRIGFSARLARGPRAAALAASAAALVIGMLSYGVWQAWWQSCLWLVAALCGALWREETDATPGAAGTARYSTIVQK